MKKRLAKDFEDESWLSVMYNIFSMKAEGSFDVKESLKCVTVSKVKFMCRVIYITPRFPYDLIKKAGDSQVPAIKKVGVFAGSSDLSCAHNSRVSIGWSLDGLPLRSQSRDDVSAEIMVSEQSFVAVSAAERSANEFA